MKITVLEVKNKRKEVSNRIKLLKLKIADIHLGYDVGNLEELHNEILYLDKKLSYLNELYFNMITVK